QVPANDARRAALRHHGATARLEGLRSAHGTSVGIPALSTAQLDRNDTACSLALATSNITKCPSSPAPGWWMIDTRVHCPLLRLPRTGGVTVGSPASRPDGPGS